MGATGHGHATSYAGARRWSVGFGVVRGEGGGARGPYGARSPVGSSSSARASSGVSERPGSSAPERGCRRRGRGARGAVPAGLDVEVGGLGPRGVPGGPGRGVGLDGHLDGLAQLGLAPGRGLPDGRDEPLGDRQAPQRRSRRRPPRRPAARCGPSRRAFRRPAHRGADAVAERRDLDERRCRSSRRRREVSAEAFVVIVGTELVMVSTRVSWSLVRLTVSVRPLSVGCTLSLVVRRLTAVSSRIRPGLAEQPGEPHHEVRERERGDEPCDPSERHRHAGEPTAVPEPVPPAIAVRAGAAPPPPRTALTPST